MAPLPSGRAGGVASEVRPPEETWVIKSDLPYFDARIIVDTSAQLVSSSYHARTNKINGGSAPSKRRPSVSSEASGGATVPPGTAESGGAADEVKSIARKVEAPASSMLQILTTHAHNFVGAERFASELVPRCRPLREQLRRTVQPLCQVEAGGGPTAAQVIDYEVDRFLRSRLVSVDLAELLEYDCFATSVPDDSLIRKFTNFAGRMPQDPDDAALAHETPMPPGKPSRSKTGFATVNFEPFFLAAGAAGGGAVGGDALVSVAQGAAALTGLGYVQRNKSMGMALTNMVGGALSTAAQAETLSAAAAQALAMAKDPTASINISLDGRASSRSLVAGGAARRPPQSIDGFASSRNGISKLTPIERSMDSAAAITEEEADDMPGAIDKNTDLYEEVVLKRFEFRFWRALVNALARSMFGDKDDLVYCFEASAQDVFDRYEGELQLSVNSLMGWLPSSVSDSLFIAFTGLPGSVAVRQKEKKYIMLHKCLRCLTHSSGRYIFVSTPTWYLPLVGFLPPVGPRLRGVGNPMQARIGLRVLWPSACLGPQECIKAVDEAWGGRILGRRAALRLCSGVEPLGPWVLRATMGCEPLLAKALTAIREFAPLFEDAYDKFVEDGIFTNVDLSIDSPEARDVAEAAAAIITQYVMKLRRALGKPQTMMRGTKSSSRLSVFGSRKPPSGSSAAHGSRFSSEGSEECTSRGATKSKSKSVGRRSSFGNSDGVMRTSTTRSIFGRFSVMPEHFQAQSARGRQGVLLRGSLMGGRISAVQEDNRNLLAMLHEDVHGIAATTDNELGQCRLRKSVFAGFMTDMGDPMSWPLGEAGSGGRIPIHDSPELRPTAEPPSMDPDIVFSSLDAPALGAGVEEPETRRIAKRKTMTRGDINAAALGTLPPDPHAERAIALGRRARSEPRAPASMLKLGDEELTLEELRDRILAESSGDASWLRANRPRASSAPPAADTAEFDSGNPHRSSAVALALQWELRAQLLAACSEGPVHLAWRKPRLNEDGERLRRIRLSLGVALMMSAVRAPLPTFAELDLENCLSFACPSAFKAEGPRPKKPLPDAIYAMGCLPLFATGATEISAATPPLMAPVFRIGVPRAMLDLAALNTGSLLVERSYNNLSSQWSEGSLLVLFAAMVFQLTHRPGTDWHAAPRWMTQDHEGFASVCCVFRFLLGVEFTAFWRRKRLMDVRITLGALLPFMDSPKAHAAGLDFQLDGGASGGRCPLLMAPWISLSLPGTPDFDPSTAEWGEDHMPGTTAVPMQDFVRWVASLDPGRIVYSSHHSPTGDLYIRLCNAVVIFSFACIPASAALLEVTDVAKMYHDAIGQPEYWGDLHVTHVIVSNKLGRYLEATGPDGACVVMKHGQEPQGCHEVAVVKNSELIMCHSSSFKVFLGALDAPLAVHQRMFEGEVKLPGFMKPRVDKRAGGKRKPAAGSGRSAADDWRSKRLQLPKQSLLDLNAEIFKALLAHVHEHSQALGQAVQALNEAMEPSEDSYIQSDDDDDDADDDDDDELYGSVVDVEGLRMMSKHSDSGDEGSPMATKEPVGSKDIVVGEGPVTFADLVEEAVGRGRERARIASEAYLLTGRNPEPLTEYDADKPRIDPQTYDPQRTEKSRRWRPPSPHLAQGPEQARRHKQRQDVNAKKGNAAAVKEAKVDFMGFESRKLGDPDAERNARQRGKRGSGGYGSERTPSKS